MENFEYSIQLSDKDWADFSEAAEECGLLQAALASGDEPLSSDIDQGDSSGSSPPGPPPPRLFRVQAGSPPPEGLLKVLGRRPLPGHLATAQGGCSGSEEEESPDSRLVSRFRCERVLAPGAGQQTRRTSAQLEEQLPSGVLSPDQLTPALVPQLSPRGSRMQKSLQEAAAQASEAGVHSGKDPPSQEQPSSRGSPEGKRSPREPHPGASPRSPGKKKRRSVGAKGSGSPKAQAPPSPSLALPPSSGIPPDRGPQTRAHGNVAPAALAGNDPGSTFPVRGAADGLSHGPDSQDPSSTPDAAPKLSPPAPGPEAGLNGSMPVPPEQSFLDVSSPVSKTEAPGNVSTPTWIPEARENPPTPVPLPGRSASLIGVASEAEPEPGGATKTGPDGGARTPTPTADLGNPPSTRLLLAKAGAGPAPGPKARLHENLSTRAPEVQPDVQASGADLESGPHVNVSPRAPGAGPDTDLSTSAQIPRGPRVQARPGGLPEGGGRAPSAPGSLGEPLLGTGEAEPPTEAVTPARTPRRKKVRFSGVSPSSLEGSDSVSPSSASPDSGGPETPRTLGGGRGGPRTWDAVAVGLHPQPRILKQPPPPASPSAPAKGSAGRREDFALTLPEAYDYFFCDTIVEEEEEEEEEDIPADLQWPEVCEYFFRDSLLPGHRGPPGAPLQAAAHVEPVPITIPEAYEHFFGEEGPSGPPWVPLAGQQPVGPEWAPLQAWPRAPAPEDQNPRKAEELGLTGSRGLRSSPSPSTRTICAWALWPLPRGP
ncbi:PGC-1 and ERR-induced regulator in muscle protein 1 isoform X2 [Gracilinanus agilis]|uniref:PGC-1 and ERR-induced regulator in muscle protein 1 isoform X2 n=1 Tax=Gracilinanus agilis TaxID=191870 RepID=UPI001CFDAB4C|nr:PGC-1 and ERR-induced regulator in muscle protein 1 isoform X2 [Gracilinanus agilis]